MIKRLSVLALLMLLSANVFAQNEAPKEKVVTASVFFIGGDAVLASQYMSDQEYSGPVLGGGAEFGAMYKRSKNLSWDLDFTYLGSSYSPTSENVCVANPARTSFCSFSSYDIDYGTYYNWNPVKNLHFKAGGTFNVLGGMMAFVPDHVNNSIEFDLQTQLKASVGVKYGYYFKKVGLSLQADIAVPFMGVAISSSAYESSVDSILGGEILGGTMVPVCFTSFHNLNGFNSEIELDLIFKKLTLFYTLDFNYRSWYLKGLQNHRNYNLNRIGLKVDLVSRNRLNSDNRYF